MPLRWPRLALYCYKKKEIRIFNISYPRMAIKLTTVVTRCATVPRRSHFLPNGVIAGLREIGKSVVPREVPYRFLLRGKLSRYTYFL